MVGDVKSLLAIFLDTRAVKMQHSKQKSFEIVPTKDLDFPAISVGLTSEFRFI